MSTDRPADPVTRHFTETREVCAACGSEKWPVTCWNCGGEGFSHHDCGEDTCCCLHPEDNVKCDICEGDGGFNVCARCHPGSFDDY